MEGMKRRKKVDKGELIFYSVFLVWPILQFCVFYLGVNFNSILLSFQDISYVGNETVVKFTFDNYINAFQWMRTEEFGQLVGVTLKSFIVTHLISVPLGFLFAYYIFKKLPCWGAFRVILYIPQILSGVVVAAIFRIFIYEALPAMVADAGSTAADSVIPLLSERSNFAFPTLMFYNIWISFGTSVLMYSNKMAGISDEIIESANLDGATGLKEFWHIVLPLAYPTISVFLITGVAQIFVNQYGVHQMFASICQDGRLKNFGYWFYVEVTKYSKGNGLPQLPYYSAIGLIITMITIPVTFFVKWALEKFGPSEE